MFHYFEAITNTKGDALIGYYVRAIEPTSGNGVSLYADESATPIISVSGLADACLVDDDGNASFWIVGGIYHLDIYATDGTTFVRRIESIPMVDFTTAFASVKDYGAVGDGVADDTDALNNALAAASQIRIPAGTYLESAVSAPADAHIDTDGHATELKQAPDTASSTRILRLAGSNSRVSDDLAVEGQLGEAGDTTDGQNHGLFIYANSTSLTNLTCGNITGTNIRGDTCFIGQAGTGLGAATITIATPGVVTNATHGLAANTQVMFTTTGALPTGLSVNTPYFVRNPATNTFELSATFGGTSINTSGSQSGVHTLYAAVNTVSGVSIGRVSAVNNYRNVVSIDAGSDISIESITGTQVGLYHLDIEPDLGAGPATGIRVGYIKGRFVGLTGTTAADYVGGVQLGYLDLNAGYTTTSSPAFGTVLTHAIEIRNLKYAHAENAVIAGFDGPAIKQTYNPGEIAKQTISFGELDVSSCSLTDATNYGYITGSTGVTRAHIRSLRGTISLSKAGLLNCDWASVLSADLTNNSADGILRNCVNAFVANLNMTGTGTPFYQTNSLVAINGSVPSTATSLCGSSDKPLFLGYSVSLASPFDTCTKAHAVSFDLNGTFYFLYAPSVYSLDSLGNFGTIGNITTSGGWLGYTTGAGGAVTQATSRTTGVTLDKVCGAITLVSAAGTATWQTFTVTNSKVAATDVIRINQKSGTDLYMIHVTNVAAGSFKISFATTGGTTTEQPVFNFAVVKATAA